MLATLAVAKELKMNKNCRDKAIDDSNLEDESENFKFKKLHIGSKSDSELDHGCKEQMERAKLCKKSTQDQ